MLLQGAPFTVVFLSRPTRPAPFLSEGVAQMGHDGAGHVIPAGVKALFIWPLRAKGPRTALLRSRTVDHLYTSSVKEEK